MPTDISLEGAASVPADDLLVTPFSAEDLREAVDDHTRLLLRRPPRARRRMIVRSALVLADLLGLSVAYLAANLLWTATDGVLGSGRELAFFILSLPGWVLVAGFHGLYRHDEESAGHATTDEVMGLVHLVTIGVWLLVVITRVAGHDGPAIPAMALFWATAVCLIPVTRTIARELCKRRPAYEQNTVIVGAGDIGQLVARKLIRHPEYGANVVGFVDRVPRMRRADLPEHLPILGDLDRLPEIVERLQVERVVISFSSDEIHRVLPVLRRLRSLNVQLDLVPRLFELIGPRVSIHSVEGVTVLGLPPVRYPRALLIVKRAIDIAGAILGLIAFAPVMLYIALRVRNDSPGPILFRQTRLGGGQRPFESLKFRTMKVGTDAEVHRQYIARIMSSRSEEVSGDGLYKLDRADTVTPFGAWLRKTSLDELPQLINVLRGDMSLVGPRPCIPYEVENFAPHHLERFLMPQGITGLWQVTARANATYGEALDMDVAYVRGWSLGLDLRLLMRTPLQVILQRSFTT